MWRSWEDRDPPDGLPSGCSPGKSAAPAGALRGAQRSTGPQASQGPGAALSRTSPSRCARVAPGPIPPVDSRLSTPPARSHPTDLARSHEEASAREANVPAQQPEAEEDPRLPCADAHPRWPCGAAVPPLPRPEASLGLIRPIRDRAIFAALARARRLRAGPVWLRAVDTVPTGSLRRLRSGRRVRHHPRRGQRGRPQPDPPAAARRRGAARGTSSRPGGPTSSAAIAACCTNGSRQLTARSVTSCARRVRWMSEMDPSR